VRCNWKVYVDNYLDGGYHVAVLHRGLAARLALGSYETRVFERHALQTVRAGGRSGASAPPPESADFAERLGEGALYAWIHPNLMLNRYGPVLDTNLVLPLGPEHCEVVFDFFFAEGTGPDFVARSIEASDAIQREDVAICESVQRGLRSSAYERGSYAPRFEAAALHFHRLLHRDLAG
jgi:choline monooxygenase